MADKDTAQVQQVPDKTQYVVDQTGKVRVVADDAQAQRLTNQGAQFVSPEAASQATARERLEIEGSGLGTAENALLGLAEGGGLGPYPAIGAAFGAGPLADPRLLQAAETTGAFKAGQFAATLPLFLEGGGIGTAGGFAENLALRFIPEGASVLGKVGRTALSMAARGSAEGALLGVHDAISKSLIHDAPLTAQTLVANGVDGALMGGLLGGAIGGTGRALGAAFEGGVGVGAGTAGKGALLRLIGATPQDLLKMEAEGGLIGPLKSMYAELQKVGKTWTNASDADLVAAAKSAGITSAGIRDGIADVLQRSAPGMTPSYERLQGVVSDIAKQYEGHAAQAEVGSVAKRLNKDIGNIHGEARTSPVYEDIATKVEPVYQAVPGKTMGKGPNAFIPTELKFEPAGTVEAKVGEVFSHFEKANWKQWFDSYDFIRNKIGQIATEARLGPEVAKKLERDLLTAVDTELTSSIESAAGGIGEKGLAAQWAGASAASRWAKHLEEMASRKQAAGMVGEGSSYLSPWDMKTVAMGGVFGGPVGALKGASIVATKGLGRMFQDWIEPKLAQKAYENMVGLRAASSVYSTRNQIRGSVRSFFGEGNKRTGAAGAKMTREFFEKKVDRASELLSPSHQQRVTQFADMVTAANQRALAQEILLTNMRAGEYLRYNLPPSTKTERSTSLRQPPAKWGLDMKEWKFDRIFGAVTDPMSVMKSLEDGTITSEEVKAVKYVYPELHKEMVTEISQGIVELKSEGKFLPVDKVTQLGLALDAPIDTILEPGFINEVQAALALPPPGMEPEGKPATSPVPQQILNTGLLTPIQQGLV